MRYIMILLAIFLVLGCSEKKELINVTNIPPTTDLIVVGDTVFHNFITVKPSYDILFGDDNSKEIGRITWEKGYLEFEGDADESARIFFEEFLKGYVDGYIQEQLEKKEPLLDLKNPSTEHEIEILDNYMTPHTLPITIDWG